MTTHILQFVSILLIGALAGTLFGLAWATSRFNERQFMQTIQLMLPPLQKWFPPLGFASIISAGWLAAASFHDRTSFFLYLLCALSVVAVIVITVAGNVPINIQLLKWDPDKPPADWAAQMKRWTYFNSLRTYVAIAGFVLLVATTVFQ